MANPFKKGDEVRYIGPRILQHEKDRPNMCTVLKTEGSYVYYENSHSCHKKHWELVVKPPKYKVGDTLQTEYDWYTDNTVTVKEIYTDSDGHLCYRYFDDVNGQNGGIDTCSIVDANKAIFKINTDEFIMTSTALSNSPPFVPVIAAALKNKEVMIPGMIVGVIGYAIGNYLGVAIAYLLR